MQRFILTLTLALALVFSLLLPVAAEKRTEDRDSKVTKPKATSPAKRDVAPAPVTKPAEKDATVVSPQQTQSTTPEVVKPTAPAQTATAQPMAGEQIKWQVLSGGGTESSSASYKLSATVGQTATGMVSSGSFKLQQGYWQDFSAPTSCCIGTTGNVNKSVAETPDLSDLSLLISFLTVTPKPTLPCLQEANVNGSVAQTPDLSDLSLLISFLTVTPKPVLPICS